MYVFTMYDIHIVYICGTCSICTHYYYPPLVDENIIKTMMNIPIYTAYNSIRKTQPFLNIILYTSMCYLYIPLLSRFYTYLM